MALRDPKKHVTHKPDDQERSQHDPQKCERPPEVGVPELPVPPERPANGRISGDDRVEKNKIETARKPHEKQHESQPEQNRTGDKPKI